MPNSNLNVGQPAAPGIPLAPAPASAPGPALTPPAPQPPTAAPLTVQSAPQGMPSLTPSAPSQGAAPSITPPPAAAANNQTASPSPSSSSLNESQRQQLDGIVQKMVSNGEPDSNIQAVVNDFKQKYGNSSDTQTSDKSVGGYISNTIGATGNLLKNTATGLIDILNPNPQQNTVVNVAKIIGGLIETPFALATGNTIKNQPFENFINNLASRYGSWDKFKNTLYTDTPGALLDIVSLLDPAAKAVGAVGEAADISALSKAGEIGGKIADTLNPVTQAAKGIGKVADATGNLAARALGVTTSAGAENIKEAFNNPSVIQGEALRGKIPAEQIVSEAKDALGTMKENRSTTYRSQLAQVKEFTAPQDITPVTTALDKSLSNFGVKVIQDEAGQPVLDFKTSTISDPAEQARVQRIYNDVNNWKDTTGGGLDTLKRRVASEFSPNSDVRAFTQSVKSSISTVLNDNIPGYKTMTSGYAQASNLLDDIQKTLSLGDKPSIDTAFKKLTTALRDNNEMRTELISQLQEAGGKDLTGAISGFQLNPVIPRGVFGRSIDLIAGGSIISGLGALFSPQILSAFAVSSPRLIGELARGLGITKNLLLKGIDKLPTSFTSNLGGLATGAAFVKSRTAPPATK